MIDHAALIPTADEVLKCKDFRALLRLLDDYDLDSVPVDAWRRELTPSEFVKLYEHYIYLLEESV